MKIVAERQEETLRCLHADLDPELFYTGLYNSRRPLAPENLTLDLKVEVDILRMERLLLERSLPQYGLPPRA